MPRGYVCMPILCFTLMFKFAVKKRLYLQVLTYSRHTARRQILPNAFYAFKTHQHKHGTKNKKSEVLSGKKKK